MKASFAAKDFFHVTAIIFVNQLKVNPVGVWNS